ncbi:MAG: DUF6901 family protein, partial [Coraliomargarita sp.]
MPVENEVAVTYTFRFNNGLEKVFEVVLCTLTGASLREQPKDLPEWTALGFKQCKRCPLSTDDCKYYPAAVSLVDIVEFFGEMSSIEQVEVVVETQGRLTTKPGVGLPQGIAALIGARFAASGCPRTKKFRPMVVNHLPFSTFQEAAYRILSMHALAQFLRMQDGLVPDWSLDELSWMCQDVNELNFDFAKRLRSLQIEDSTLNALTGLDSFV